MRVGLYARVSTERQQERGTIGSQLEALRAAARADGHEVIEEFIDNGYSGARLDRPALDRLRDAAEAGVLDGVLCLCVDRLARAYAYQVLILEELERFGVTVHFLEGPAPSDDPQATLLIQMQGVIAEYEKAKVAERNRRGKLYRARAGEIPFWKVSYGYRRVVDPDRGRSRIEGCTRSLSPMAGAWASSTRRWCTRPGRARRSCSGRARGGSRRSAATE